MREWVGDNDVSLSYYLYDIFLIGMRGQLVASSENSGTDLTDALVPV